MENTPDASSGGVASLVFAPTPGGIASPPPPPPPPSSGVLFSDDFNRSNSTGLGPNWNVLAGVWFDNGEAAQTDSHPLNRATVANISCSDCRIDAQMVNFGGGDSMLELRAGSTDRYALALRTDGVPSMRNRRAVTHQHARSDVDRFHPQHRIVNRLLDDSSIAMDGTVRSR